MAVDLECPQCGSTDIQAVSSKAKEWRCLSCGALLSFDAELRCTCDEDMEGFCPLHGYWDDSRQRMKRLKK